MSKPPYRQEFVPLLPFATMHELARESLSPGLAMAVAAVLLELAKEEPTLQHVRIWPLVTDGDENYDDLRFALVYSDRPSKQRDYAVVRDGFKVERLENANRTVMAAA